MARRFDRIGWAMAQQGLTSPEKFVLVVLADASAEIDGACWLSHSTIAERTSLGESTVRRVLTGLQDKELVDVNQRFMSNGKQTSNLYRLGCYTDLDEEGARREHPAVASTSPARSEHHVEPTTRSNRKKDNQTSSGSRSSRRAARERDEAGWTDPAAAVFAKQQDDGGPDTINPRGGPDSAWNLNGYYREKVFLAGTGRVGNTNDGAMRKFFAEARRCGVKPETLRSMVDCFVEDPQLFNRTRQHRWKVFIANAPLLQDRAEVYLSVGRISDENPGGIRVASGAIPQAVLDEILAEAG